MIKRLPTPYELWGDCTIVGWASDEKEALFKLWLKNIAILIVFAEQAVIDRVGNVLADGIARGDSVDTIATSLSDAVTANAYMIADTECARAFESASQDTYEVNGISQWEWIAEDNACEDCLENADNGPYDVGTDDPSIPEHPLCRCASTAVTGYE